MLDTTGHPHDPLPQGWYWVMFAAASWSHTCKTITKEGVNDRDPAGNHILDAHLLGTGGAAPASPSYTRPKLLLECRTGLGLH